MSPGYLKVVVGDGNGAIERAIRIFQKGFMEQVVDPLSYHKFALTGSQRRRLKDAKASSRTRKRKRKMELARPRDCDPN